MVNIQPIRPKKHLEILNADELASIQTATLQLLEDVGVRFPSERALGIFAEHGAEVDKDSQIVLRGLFEDRAEEIWVMRFYKILVCSIESHPFTQVFCVVGERVELRFFENQGGIRGGFYGKRMEYYPLQCVRSQYIGVIEDHIIYLLL